MLTPDMNARTSDADRNEHCELPGSHPGHGLVTARQFARLRAEDLVPRPLERRRRAQGYGSTVLYPVWTRTQLEHQQALEEAGVRGPGNQRLLLWLDGYPIPLSRVEADLRTISDSALEFAARARHDLEADRIVFEMLDRHDPSAFVRWAREQLPARSELETALFQMVQLTSGVPPADLLLDPEAAKPLYALLDGVLPHHPEPRRACDRYVCGRWPC